MLLIETMTTLDLMKFLIYCWMFGLGMGYAWRAFWQFF